MHNYLSLAYLQRKGSEMQEIIKKKDQHKTEPPNQHAIHRPPLLLSPLWKTASTQTPKPKSSNQNREPPVLQPELFSKQHFNFETGMRQQI